VDVGLGRVWGHVTSYFKLCPQS